MIDVGPPIVELRLLTHRPQEMVAWWAALLGVGPQSLNTRMTAITGPSLRVVIERSQIALDYHPEASGVTAINLNFDDRQEVDRTLNRLVPLGFTPCRATRNRGVIALWLRDPNGTDVTLCFTASPGSLTADADILPEELDVKAVLAASSHEMPMASHGSRNTQKI
jgi:catechol-2,3-dioxygenase